MEIRPISVTSPICGVDVDAGRAEDAADVERQQRAEHRGRQRDQDDQRIAEAFELRGEHEIDDDQREDEGVDERVAFLLVLPANRPGSRR